MTDLVAHMTAVSHCALLRQLMTELETAIETGEPAEIARADHALRNGLMGLMGTLSLEDRECGARLDLLEDLLVSMRRAIACLTAQSARQARTDRCNLVYLRAEYAGKPRR